MRSPTDDVAGAGTDNGRMHTHGVHVPLARGPVQRRAGQRARRSERVPGWALDALAAVVMTLLLLVISAHVPAEPGGRRLDALAYVLLVLAGVSMAVSRRWPRTVTAVTTAVL